MEKMRSCAHLFSITTRLVFCLFEIASPFCNTNKQRNEQRRDGRENCVLSLSLHMVLVTGAASLPPHAPTKNTQAAMLLVLQDPYLWHLVYSLSPHHACCYRPGLQAVSPTLSAPSSANMITSYSLVAALPLYTACWCHLWSQLLEGIVLALC